jgi:hypothetical protein
MGPRHCSHDAGLFKFLDFLGPIADTIKVSLLHIRLCKGNTLFVNKPRQANRRTADLWLSRRLSLEDVLCTLLAISFMPWQRS